jgi:HEAT repeat protein
LIRRWHASVRNRDQRGILESQAAFRERESEYRAPLERLAEDDPDPRVRAFTVTLLGGFRSPPSESFFIGRLPDPSEYPRESALAALSRLGTSVDRIAASDPVEAVRRAAARTAAIVRNR